MCTSLTEQTKKLNEKNLGSSKSKLGFIQLPLCSPHRNPNGLQTNLKIREVLNNIIHNVLALLY